MGFSLGFLVGIFGVLILSQAAYSTVRYRGLLKIMEEDFSGPPITVVAELVIGLVLSLLAGLLFRPRFCRYIPSLKRIGKESNRDLY